MLSRVGDAADNVSTHQPAVAATGDFSVADADSASELAAVPNRMDSAPQSPIAGRERLGQYRLLEKLGAGGMGEVFRAEDTERGTIVAVKVLAADVAKQPDALRRFHKEARLLAEVQCPHIANLIEVSEDDGIHFLVMEYVAGRNLAAFVRDHGPLDEPLALQLMADVARGLAVAHERGIVHRDIKPENVLLVGSEQWAVGSADTSTVGSGLPTAHRPLPTTPFVKLTDFGLARHEIESESLNLTKTGAILGTPLYMSPEECSGRGDVDARTDVYACGATLFAMLTGRPPFLADSPLALIAMHCNDPPPPIEKFNLAVSAATSQLIQKTLAKNPDSRYANAAELLNDLERLLRGEPTSIAVHPRLPTHDAKRIIEFNWSWQLDASPAELWPHVSNTERLNRAVGLQAPQFTTEKESDGPTKRIARIRSKGLEIAWQEHPFEWIEGRRFGVLREFSKGPFKWYTSVVELEPRVTGGTLLTHRLKIEPNGLLGRTVAAIEVGMRSKRALDRVYRRIDAAVTGRLGSRASADPFEPPAELPAARRRKLDGLLEKLTERGIDPTVVEQLGDFVAQAPDQEVARMRPIALARRLSLPTDQVVAACLHGARDGLLSLLWDILCPVCRIPSEVKETLCVIRDHGRCEACNLDFELDFANSVEMIFRAHPEIRDVELGTFCIGGPVHSPHVVAQTRVAPGERIEVGLAMTEGTYRLRGPQLPFAIELRVDRSATSGRIELDLAQSPGGLRSGSNVSRTLRPGSQVVALTNSRDVELLVRIERTAPRDDALTAARAASLALFRELFPGEILSPGQLINVATITLLVTDLDDSAKLYQELGDAGAFTVLHEHFRILTDVISREGGAVIKTIGEGIVAAFADPAAAVRAGVELQPQLQSNDLARNLKIGIAVHRGPAMVATVNDHLDYFGTTVRLAYQLVQRARGGLLVSADLRSDPEIATILKRRADQISTAPMQNPESTDETTT
jgi:serine/threonine protein kinase/class 3 adenylate cyclase